LTLNCLHDFAGKPHDFRIARAAQNIRACYGRIDGNTPGCDTVDKSPFIWLTLAKHLKKSH
jgi:hypothetical protein